MELIRGLIKGYLMKETIGACSAYKASYSRLVRDILKIKIQVILKHEDVSMVAVPEAGRHGVEQLGTSDSQGTSPGLPDSSSS